jgi:uncharacterized membrane protein YphA (DoxX/SURF4 family)
MGMDSKILNNQYLIFAARFIVGTVFLTAAIGKIANPDFFAKEIGHYNILPYFSLNFVALTMPWIELAAAILLISGVRVKANAAICGGLLILFIIALTLALLQGLNINCGCHSQLASQKVGFPKIAENIVTLGITTYIFLFPNSKLSLDYLAMGEG